MKKKNQNKYSSKVVNKVNDIFINETINSDLIIDPDNKYNFSEIEKKFIEGYIELKNLNLTASFCSLSEQEAKNIFLKINVQNEIRRLSKLRVEKQFASRLLTLDEVGGYLSSLLTGENVALADQLTASEKLKVVDQIIKLNELKTNIIINPDDYEIKNVDDKLKNLSVEAIKLMLSANDLKLSQKDMKEIKSLPVQGTLDVLNEISKGDLKNNNE